MHKHSRKIELAVVSNAGKKTNVLEVETVFNDGKFSGGGRRYCLQVSTMEKGVSETGMPFTAFELAGTCKRHTFEGANRFNAKRLDFWHGLTASQVQAREGKAWELIEAVLLADDLTLISAEPIAA